MPATPLEPAISPRPVALWRRLAAIFYDTLALIGIGFVVAGIGVGLEHGVAVPAGDYRLRGILVLLSYGYFAVCWRRSGQTLGMGSWRIKLVDGPTGGRVSWRQTLLRFAAGSVSWLLLGMGFWWSLTNSERMGWPERASGTRLVNVAKS